jgi:hypothetical protein
VPNPSVGTRSGEHRFFFGMSIAILGAAAAGFLKSYLLVPWLGLPVGEIGYPPLVHLHAALSFGWCILFVLQSGLVATGRTRLHIKLGWFGLAVYALLVISGPFVAVRSAARHGASPEDLAFLAVSTGNILAYTLLFGAAIHFRKRPDVHKRLMLLGMVAMLTASFGRLMDLPYHLNHVVGPGLVVVALAAWDQRSLGKLHPVTRYGGPAILLWELLPNVFMNREWWLNLARWMVRTLAN